MALFVVYWQSGRFRMQMLAIRISAIQQHFTFGPIPVSLCLFLFFLPNLQKKTSGIRTRIVGVEGEPLTT